MSAKKPGPKLCTGCGETRPRSAFVFDRRGMSMGAKCRRCRGQTPKAKARNKARRQRYQATEAGRAKYREYAAARRTKRPDAIRAQSAIGIRVRLGKIIRPERCEACGLVPPRRIDGRATVQAHHHDGYDKPLAVRWLCPKCHAQEHREAGTHAGRTGAVGTR